MASSNLIVPPQAAAPLDGDKFSRVWYLFLNAVASALNAVDTVVGAVLGGAALTNVGKLTKVGAAGTLAESAVTDDGVAVVSVAGRDLAVGATAPYTATAGRRYATLAGVSGVGVLQMSTGAADTDTAFIGLIESHDTACAATRTAYIITRKAGTTAGNRGSSMSLAVKADAGAVAETVLLTSTLTNSTVDINTGGVYKKGGVAGITATITTAKVTAGGANGSMVFSGGILTAQTQAT